VRGSQSGKRYRIKVADTIFSVSTRAMGYGSVRSYFLPLEDHALMLKLLIETNEPYFLARACRQPFIPWAILIIAPFILFNLINIALIVLRALL
jgi:hypothetical protein